MPLVNQTLSLSKAAVYTASLLNFPLAHPAFPQSRLLLEKTSPMKVDMTSRGKELGSLGLPAENKCQPSSLFHLVLKSLFFHTMLQRHMNRAAPGAAPQFPKGVYWSLNSRKPTVRVRQERQMRSWKTFNHLYVLVSMNGFQTYRYIYTQTHTHTQILFCNFTAYFKIACERLGNLLRDLQLI